MMRDNDFGIVRVRAFGTYDFRIVEPEAVPEGSRRLRPQLPARRVRRHDALAHRQRLHRRAGVGEGPGARRRDRATRELGEALLPLINPVVTAKYGLEIASFIVENVSVPPEVEQAIDKRSSMAAVGNLNDYVKYQMAQGHREAAAAAARRHGRGAGGRLRHRAADDAAAGPWRQAQAAPGRAGGSAMPELLGPAEAAQALGVSEADVVAVLESGELKAKKIGASYRIKRSALDEYLAK